MNKKYMKLFIICIIIYLNKYSLNLIINTNPLLIGTWRLRTTNDKKIDEHSYLILNEDNTFKLRSLKYDNFIAIKTSRTGIIKNINKNPLKLPFDKNIELKIGFTSYSKYSYSIFGIEIPEFKIISNNNYKIEKYIDIYYEDKTLFIQTKKGDIFYIFDLYIKDDKMPHIEITLNNLIITQIISFIINLILTKIL